MKREEALLRWSSDQEVLALRLIDELLEEETGHYPDLLMTKARWLAKREAPTSDIDMCIEVRTKIYYTRLECTSCTHECIRNRPNQVIILSELVIWVT